MTFAAVLRAAREEFNLSIKDLAREVDVSAATLCRLEYARTDPSWRVALKLSKYLGFSLDDFRESIQLPGEV